MARSTMTQICPICGLEFYDLDFHIRIDEESPEVAERFHPEHGTLDRRHPNPSDVWTVHGVGRLLRVLH